MITIDDFHTVEIRIGRITSAERVPETDKLVKLSVDMGEPEPRQVVSGIALYFEDVSALVGKKCAFAANLEPRTIKGLESKGMILAASTEDGAFSLLEVSESIPPGTLIR